MREVAVIEPPRNRGWSFSTWVALTLVSVSTMVGGGMYATGRLQEFCRALAITLYQEAINETIRRGWNLAKTMGREKAKDYADSLIDTVAEAVGSLDAMPQAAAEAVRAYRWVEMGLSILLGAGTEFWVEKWRKKGDFSVVRSFGYMAGYYGSLVGLRVVVFTETVTAMLSSVESEAFIDWYGIKDFVRQLIDYVFPEVKPKKTKKRRSDDIRDYGEEL